jgi:hypothetical protein
MGTRPRVDHGGSVVWLHTTPSPPSHTDEDFVLIDDDRVVALTEWTRCNASLAVADDVAEHMARCRKALSWSVEQHLRYAMFNHQLRDVCVRMPYDFDASSWTIRARARCSSEQAERLRQELLAALTFAVETTRKSLALQYLMSIAQRPTAGDVARSHASWVRRLGMPVRCNGIFNATGWAEIGGYIGQNKYSHYSATPPLDWETDSRDCAARPSRRALRRL